MSVISDAKKLLKHAKRWTRDERVIDMKLAEVGLHRNKIHRAKTGKEQMKHVKRFHRSYKQLAFLVADKKKIEYDIRRIHREIEKELAKRRRLI